MSSTPARGTGLRYEGQEEPRTWFKPTKTETDDAGEQKATCLSGLFLVLHSWQVWLQPQEPHEVASLSPGCCTFAYGHR